VAGILFLSAHTVPADLQLAVDLFEEEDWSGCRRECLRVISTTPDSETARLFAALSAVRAGTCSQDAEGILRELAETAQDIEVQCLAAYEVGHAEWANGNVEEAYDYLVLAFQKTKEPMMFRRASCSLEQLMYQHRELLKKDTAVTMQVQSCRSLWSPELVRACRIDANEDGKRWTSLPAAWIVGFYRHQIAPAIGHRCSLHPSCSEYFLRASKAHGLLGVPMQADRLVREPGVVAAAEKTTEVRGRTRIADPVEDHDWWMEE